MTQESSTAVIRIAPEQDIAWQGLYLEAQGFRDYAVARVIVTNEDLKPATDDLSLIAKLKKAVEEKRKEYVSPIRERLDAINDAFKTLMAPIEEADRITREKILAFRTEQNRIRLEAEAIEREKLELARREAVLKAGEVTVDLSPVEKPLAVPSHVRTEVGTLGTMKVKKWEVQDFSKVPDDYKIVNSAKITKLVKAGIGAIPGIHIWEEETVKVTTR